MSKLVIKPQSRVDKNLIFRGKKYPINFGLMQQYSNYFFEHRHEYENEENIEIPEFPIEISEEDIQMFICCCQGDQIKITNMNVFSLHQLAIQYEVQGLITLTADYIVANDKDLIFQKIQNLLQTKNQSDPTFEEYIASHFFDYIDSEELISLPIFVLYRIINNPILNMQSMQKENQIKLIDFLFKCLDKHKKKASILFSLLDLNNAPGDISNRLMNDYENVFDFSMIDSKYLIKTTSELYSQITKLDQIYSNKISEFESKIKLFESNMNKTEELQNQISNLIETVNSQKDQIFNLTETVNSQKDQISNLIETVNSQKNQISNLTETVNSQKDQISNLTETVNSQKDQISNLTETANSKASPNNQFITKTEIRTAIQS